VRCHPVMASGPSAAPSPGHARALARRGVRTCLHAGRRLLLHRRSRGQALVEFALILPILFVLIMGLIEFAMAFNAVLSINRASQNAAHTASIAGNMEGADCLILEQVEQDIGAPQNKNHIRTVEIQRTALAGNVVYATNSWSRSGNTSCSLNDGTSVTVPYTRTENGYPVNQRCNVLSGCPTYTPARTTVDNIGVAITYRYDWITPLGTLLPFVGGDKDASHGWTFSKRNVFRMEPNL
jgi:Flp pilus assembly protein TadG